nr:putative pentatricopeptide repeat-containing protein At3g15930 [Ipomoea batatas]
MLTFNLGTLSKNLTCFLNSAFTHNFFCIASLCGNPTHLLHFSTLVPSRSLLQTCESMDHLKQIHAFFIRKCLSSDPVICSKIIAFCCTHSSGDMRYALHLFETMLEPNVFVWNTMIKAYSRVGSPGNAVSLYLDMLRNNVKPDNYTFPFLLKGFTPDIAMALGKGVHAHVCKFGFEFNEFVQHSLIHMYFMCGEINMARGVFDGSAKTDVLIWNVMISGFNKNNKFEESRRLFVEMEEKQIMPTAVTLISLLSAFSELKDLEAGKLVHQYVKDCNVIESDLLILNNALIDMYAGSGEMEAALGVFQRMKHRDVISWTSIVKGFLNSGRLDLARSYFDKMPEKDSVSWTAMIDGYIKENRFKDVLLLFREMQEAADVKPDEFTMVSVLTACAQLGALELGEWVKAYIDKNRIKVDLHLGNAVIDMYFKCGNVEKAVAMFNHMPKRDKFTWTAMILGLAVNGHGRESLHFFSQMLRASETPDAVTYIGLLCACTHTGMVEQGRKFFTNMTALHGIEPNVTHYGCLVDLLGRAGRLTEAHEVIKTMPMTPNSVVWGALLAACRVHKDVEMAGMAATQLLQLEPENGGVYVLLCNIYAACKKWEKLGQLRRAMMDKGIKKTPGCSLIEMNGVVHEFVAGDQSHPQSAQIYSKIEEVVGDLKLAGYVPDTSEVYMDIGEEEKEKSVSRHSEKLAIAFALMSSGPGFTIRVVKNLRMCIDCHEVAKLISRIYGRKLIVRDKTRFHHFMDGSCSCKDYW